MSDEFQVGSGNWWHGGTSRTEVPASTTTSSSSTSLNNNNNNNSNSIFGWQTDEMKASDMKGRSSLSSMMDSGGGRNSMGGGGGSGGGHVNFGIDSSGVNNNNNNLLTVDPSLHMMGLGLSSQTMDWNHHHHQPLYTRSEKEGDQSSFRSNILDEEGNRNNFHQWTTTFKQFNQRPPLLSGGGGGGGGLSLDEPHSSSSYHTTTSHQNSNFPVGVVDSAPPPPYGISSSNNNNNNNNNNPNVIQGLLLSSSSSDNHHHHQPHQTHDDDDDDESSAAFDHSRSLNYSISSYPLPSASSYGGINQHQLIHTNSNWSSKFPDFLRTSPSPPPPPPTKQHHQPAHDGGGGGGQLHFSNNTPFWNAISTNTTNSNINSSDGRSTTFFPSLHQTQQHKPNNKSSSNSNTSEVRELTTIKKSSTSSEASNKRSRNETTPSPMPAFKVRKEKMGDRITALQQLVSPFGKTDTASVLSEAIEYIKFLHEQVSVLSTPYMKSGGHLQQIAHEIINKSKDGSGASEGGKQDLRSRGLCLVPVPTTFPVINESNFDFWNPTFGGTYR